MGRGRRYLVARAIAASVGEEFATEQERLYAECPEAAQYTDEQAEDFLHAAQYMDTFSRSSILANLRSARISFPVELTYDVYRLGRHVLGKWHDAALRTAFLHHAWYFTKPVMRRLKASEGVHALMPSVELHGTPAVISTLRHNNFADVIPEVVAALSPAQATRYRALLQFAKRRMHEFITQPEPGRQPSRWEQQKMARRIRLRDVQLRSMQRSVHSLHQERRELFSRLRESKRQQHPELDALATELARLRAGWAEAARQHAAALAQQARAHREAVAHLSATLAAELEDYHSTLAVRAAWSAGERGR
jgi:hypothetical protein